MLIMLHIYDILREEEFYIVSMFIHSIRAFMLDGIVEKR